ncbi:cyclopropane fatty acyl phospholipid synthase [Pseudomonas sp. RIT-PI-q]|uniref:cyclopropane fatty acyl phospholipid synthase n=1 Tax=Pseudomonas sp. RIT-PI-q TaxID=1690247 RepID=UPI0006CCF4DE|nr:cyclopropane fatty acyl phospholipid synthase [Pseudomonas sp. RIT-PI-q]KPG92131.1 cyclopropane fatty acyl phospholipid synthase [Pseudomonas sp. RIT-PI-q]
MRTELTGCSDIEISKTKAYQFIKDLLKTAGLSINGGFPFDMKLLGNGVPELALSKGNLGLGEAYMAGLWECEELDEFFARLLRSGVTETVNPLSIIFHALSARFTNRQTQDKAWEVGERHYDLGNDFYSGMLDGRLTYTCGYWKEATTLAEAQTAKLDLICRKLDLQPGMRVLDIGCGWGSFMSYAAEHYGVECVGVTISKEQCDWAKNQYRHLPVEFRLQDYRDLDEQFDHIVSVGMFEHVGRKNHRVYMETVNRCLKDDGLFLLHTIGKNITKTAPDPWIDKYIFPNGDLPSIAQIAASIEGLFVAEDLHNFGADYDKTLMAWFHSFEKNWGVFAAELGERFYRMWKYYLLSCAGAFRARDIQLWQWVLSKKGVLGGYERVS